MNSKYTLNGNSVQEHDWENGHREERLWFEQHNSKIIRRRNQWLPHRAKHRAAKTRTPLYLTKRGKRLERQGKDTFTINTNLRGKVTRWNGSQQKLRRKWVEKYTVVVKPHVKKDTRTQAVSFLLMYTWGDWAERGLVTCHWHLFPVLCNLADNLFLNCFWAVFSEGRKKDETGGRTADWVYNGFEQMQKVTMLLLFFSSFFAF